MSASNPAPRYVDLQVNGHGGVDFLSASSTDDIRRAARSLYSNGVKSFLPTLITSDPLQLKASAALIREVVNDPRSGEAEILGFHLEGPFISHEKSGVHPQKYIVEPNIALMKEYLEIGSVRIVTLAPELHGAIDLIKFLVDQNIVVSLGHSNATPDEANAGFDAGAKTVTHLFNAMSKIPGLASAALDRDDVTIQIIVDDVHVDRPKVQIALEKASDRFIVTNDAVAPAGSGDGIHNFGEMKIQVKDGQARHLDGTLAGGIGTLAKSLQILAEMGVSYETALASVTTRPLALINQ